MHADQQKQALALAIEAEREHLGEAVSALKQAARAEVERVKDRFDLKQKIAEQPLRYALGAFAVGLWIGLRG